MGFFDALRGFTGKVIDQWNLIETQQSFTQNIIFQLQLQNKMLGQTGNCV